MATTGQLNGLFPPDFQPAQRLQIDIREGPSPGFQMPRFGPFEMEDARPIQAGAQSRADFFDAHGFVLLDHISAIMRKTCARAAIDATIVATSVGEIGTGW